MPWVNISNTAIDQDSPITVSLMTALRDNPIAIANGDSGAPRIQTAALNDLCVTNAKIADFTIGAYKTSGAAIKQYSLDTSSGEVSQTSAYGLSNPIALPGGEYGFAPQLRTVGSASHLRGVMASNSTTYVTAIAFVGDEWEHTHDGSGSLAWGTTGVDAYARQRYVNSSPPYNLGDGDVPLFVFALLADNGEVISTYAADVPPWAYNGPTRVAVDRRCRLSGRLLQVVRQFNPETGQVESYEREVCHRVKNADMHIIPHPFIGANGGRVVLLEPPRTEALHDMHRAGASIAELLHGGYVKLTNDISCASSPGVLPVAFKFRNAA